MNDQIKQLLAENQSGHLSRRDFIVRAGLLFGGASLSAAALTTLDTSPIMAQTGTPVAPMPTGTPSVTITSRMVEFEANGQITPAYLSRPDGDGAFPGIVVVQEWWGLDDHIKEVGRLLAQHGFVTIAPDLYRGELATEPNEARKLAMALVMDQALADVQGAADYLESQAYVKPKKVGVVGFCMGGRIAMTMAWEGHDNIGAVVSFYGGGTVITSKEAQQVKVPILGLYGDLDAGIPVAQIDQWRGLLNEQGKINELIVYKGAQHAFFNNTRPAYHAEAAADALKRMLAWFNTYLRDEDATATPDA